MFVTKVDLYFVEVLHNGTLKTAGMNRVKSLSSADSSNADSSNVDSSSPRGAEYSNTSDSRTTSALIPVSLYDYTDSEDTID